MFYKSLTFKTTEGAYIHLDDVDEIRDSPFKDEAGLVQVLASADLKEDDHIWLRIGDHIYALFLKDDYNARSTGINISHFTYSPDLTVEERVARAIINTWGELNHPRLAEYYTSRVVREY